MELIHTVYQPAGGGPYPTIIAMHGWGANALDLIGLAPYIADAKFMVICPQGPIDVTVGPTRGYGWYPMRERGTRDPEAIRESVHTVAKFVDQASEKYPVDRSKLVILGFSQGGFMAYSLAIRNPAKFSALVAISTWFPPELKAEVNDRAALARLSTLVQHGRADEMVEIARARTSIETLRELKVPVAYHEYDCGHEITADGLEDLSAFLNSKVLSPIVTL